MRKGIFYHVNILLISFQKDLITIGLKYLHCSLLQNGYESTVLYLPDYSKRERSGADTIKRFIMELDPGIIGISLMSIEYHAAAGLTGRIKSFAKDTPVIWGGIHPTISPESCLAHADYVCVGEGEGTMLDAARAVEKKGSLAGINNLCYLEDGRLKKNPLYPLIEDLDGIPSYEHIPRNSFILDGKTVRKLDRRVFKRYARHLGRVYSVITTRGCPYFCTYCCNNFISRLYGSSRIRRRSIENVMEELEMAVKDNPEIEYINFLDDCFLACAEYHLKRFCGTYDKRVGRPFVAKAIPAYITEAKLMTLKEAGLAWIQMGLQSGSDRVCRDIYKRRSSSEDFLKAAAAINRLEIAPYYDIILDNPFETEEDRLCTLRTLMKTPKPFYAQFYSLTFYPGTEIYEMAKSEKPGCIEDCLTKDYFAPRKNAMNGMIRLAPFIGERYL